MSQVTHSTNDNEDDVLLDNKNAHLSANYLIPCRLLRFHGAICFSKLPSDNNYLMLVN